MAFKVEDPRDIDQAYQDGLSNLSAAEQAGSNSAYVDEGIAKLEAYANDPKNHDPTDMVRDGEETSGAWQDNTTKRSSAAPGGGGGRFRAAAKLAIQKKSATAAIVALLGIGGATPFIIGGTLPFAILGNMDLKNPLHGLMQYDLDYRNFKATGGSKAGAAGTAKAALTGYTAKEVKMLENRGVVLEGKKTGANGRTTFTSLKTNKNAKSIPVANLASEYRKNPTLRKVMETNRGSFWKTAKNQKAMDVRTKLKLTSNPDLKGKNDEERNKKLLTSSTSGTTSNYKGIALGDSDDSTPDGSKEKASEMAGQIDGELKDKINAQQSTIANGEIPENAGRNSNMGNVGMQLGRDLVDPLEATSTTGSKIWGVINALEPLDMLCTTYNLAHTANMAARTVALVNITRFYMNVRTSIEKVKAGQDTDGQSMQYLMGLIQQKDPSTGLSFDATAYASMLFNGKLSSYFT